MTRRSRIAKSLLPWLAIISLLGFGACSSPTSPEPGPTSFTVSFDSQSASVEASPSKMTVSSPGAAVGSLPSPPSLAGHSFAGWWTEKNGGGTAFSSSTVVSHDITVYAYWVTVHAVSFDGQAATTEADPPIVPVNPPATTVASMPKEPARTGYSFGGWWTGTGGSGSQFTSATTVDSSLVVYAKWIPDIYTVIFDSQSPTTPASPSSVTVTVPATTLAALPSAPTKNGFSFGGWWTAPNAGGTSFNASTPVGASLTVYASWNPAYSVTYYANGASGSVPVDSTLYAQGQTVHASANTGLSYGGYTFAGWMTQTAGTGSSYAANASFAIGNANVGLYAIWVPTTVTFTASGSSITLTKATPLPSGSFTVPTGITALASDSFYGATAMTGLTIPASVRSIATAAFGYCPALTSISVNASNPSFSSASSALLDKTGATLLAVPAGLSSFTIPASVRTIAGNAFDEANCSGGLTSITIPATVTTIGNSAFYYCGNLTSVYIPASVTSIGLSPFSNATKLTALTVSASNPNYKAVGNVLFSADGKTLIQCPSGLTGSYAIPAGVTSIQSAFTGSKLTSVSFPASLAEASSCAFWGAELTTVIIPSTITVIQAYAFYGCSNLASVTMQAVSPPSLGTNAFQYCSASLSFHVPSAAAVTSYKASSSWSGFTIVTP